MQKISQQLGAEARTSRLRAYLHATERTEGGYSLSLTLNITAPWYVFAPGSSQGLPISLTAAQPASVTDLSVASDELDLRGTVELTAVLTGAGPGTTLVLRTQACNGASCEIPTSVKLKLSHRGDE